MPRIQVTETHSARHAGHGFHGDDEPTEPRLIEPIAQDLIAPLPARGLAKFDLGTVPASVTPPQSWRRAAWFAVTSAVAVLVMLVFMTTSMVGPPTPADKINAMPDYPGRQSLGLPAPAGGSSVAGDYGAHQAASRRSHDNAPADNGIAATSDPPPTSGVSIASSAAGSTDPTASQGPYPPTSFPPPTTTTVPPDQQTFAPARNPQQLIDTTESYLKKVATDPEAAHEMTSGSLYDEGTKGIETRYPDADAVRVERIEANPNDGTTTDRITIYRHDHTTVTEVRKLTFTRPADPSADPQISADDKIS